jgi:c-di-GMP-binding flagellar brake protein YcgR
MATNNNLELKHNIGDTVQLQFFPGKEEDRYYVKLIGFLDGKSIMVTTPRSQGAALRINTAQEFIVRLVSGNSAKGFNAATIHASSHPYPHLHLTFPTKLESTTVRKAERVDCTLIVSVQNDEDGKAFNEGKSAAMKNLSTAGAQITSNEPLGEVGEKISITCKVTVATFEQYLNINGIIRRTSENEDAKTGQYQYGIEFIVPNDSNKLLLHGFIYEKMLNISV